MVNHKIDEFLLANQQKSPQTLSHERNYLDVLDRAYPQTPIENLSETDILKFLKRYKNPSTWNLRFVLFRQFFNWLGKDYLKEQKFKRLNGSLGKRARDALDWTQEHTNWLIEACLNMRDKVLIAVLCECGFRRGEVTQIRFKGVVIDEYGVLLTCDDGKTGGRTVRGIWCTALVSAWKDQHPLKTPNSPFFCNLTDRDAYSYERNGQVIEVPASRIGDPLEEVSISSIVKGIWKRAKKLHPDLPRFHPHKGRHISATEACKMGLNTQAMKIRYGWATNSMPDVYTHITGADVDDQVLRLSGVKKRIEDEPIMRLCPRCQSPNQKDGRYCAKCGSPLTLKIAMEFERKEEKIDQMLSKLFQNPKALRALAKALQSQGVE